MYEYFKSVLKIIKDAHKKALQGKSNVQKKLQEQLLRVTADMQENYKVYHQLTDEQYRELATEFSKISFVRLGEQRRGTYKP